MFVKQGHATAHVPTPHHHPERRRLAILAALALEPEPDGPLRCVECDEVIDVADTGCVTVMCNDCFAEQFGQEKGV